MPSNLRKSSDPLDSSHASLLSGAMTEYPSNDDLDLIHDDNQSLRVRVGDLEKQVHDNNAPLGGEFSGHIFFNDRWKGFDDGLYAAVRLLEILSDLGLGLDEVLDELQGSIYTPEILIPVDEAEKFELIKTLEAGCQFAGAQVITIDGLRVEYSYGWGLIRASNTSANLTLRFEADDESGLDRVKQEFCRELAPFINNIEDYI